MELSAISYRVADFLKQHPPFHAIADADLLQLSAHGRVRFHETVRHRQMPAVIAVVVRGTVGGQHLERRQRHTIQIGH